MVKLFPHVGQLLRESGFRFFTTSIKVELYLAQGFQPSDQIVVKDAKVCEWLSFCLTSLLLDQLW